MRTGSCRGAGIAWSASGTATGAVGAGMVASAGAVAAVNASTIWRRVRSFRSSPTSPLACSPTRSRTADRTSTRLIESTPRSDSSSMSTFSIATGYPVRSATTDSSSSSNASAVSSWAAPGTGWAGTGSAGTGGDSWSTADAVGAAGTTGVVGPGEGTGAMGGAGAMAGVVATAWAGRATGAAVAPGEVNSAGAPA